MIENKEHTGEHFRDLSFIDMNLAEHVFEDCVFINCDFKSVVLDKSRMIDCRYEACDLSNISLTSATMRGLAFVNCKLLGVQWPQVEQLVNLSFTECNLNYCNFVGMKLKKIVFNKCFLREVDFSHSDLAESDFREANLLNARFNGSSLLKADFRRAIDYQINPLANKIQGARFSLPEAQELLIGLGIILD